MPSLSPCVHRLAHAGEALAADPPWCAPRMSGHKVCALPRRTDPAACFKLVHLRFQIPLLLISDPVSLMFATPIAYTSAMACQVPHEHPTGQAAARANSSRFLTFLKRAGLESQVAPTGGMRPADEQLALSGAGINPAGSAARGPHLSDAEQVRLCCRSRPGHGPQGHRGPAQESFSGATLATQSHMRLQGRTRQLLPEGQQCS